MILRISTLQQWEIRLGFYTIRSSLVAQLGKNLSAMQETPVQFWGWEILWRRNRLPTPVLLGFPCGSAGKESTWNAGDLGSILGLGRSPREGKGYPLQYSGLENSMENAGLKLNIQKTKIMASSPITSWKIDGKTMETVSDFIFLGSKIPPDGDCSHEIKRRLVLGRKVMINLDSIFKSRDIMLPTKVHLVKAIVPVVMYGKS